MRIWRMSLRIWNFFNDLLNGSFTHLIFTPNSNTVAAMLTTQIHFAAQLLTHLFINVLTPNVFKAQGIVMDVSVAAAITICMCVYNLFNNNEMLTFFTRENIIIRCVRYYKTMFRTRTCFDHKDRRCKVGIAAFEKIGFSLLQILNSKVNLSSYLFRF